MKALVLSTARSPVTFINTTGYTLNFDPNKKLHLMWNEEEEKINKYFHDILHTQKHRQSIEVEFNLGEDIEGVFLSE